MIHHGDLFDVLPTLEAESFDACVTDPPYGIGFMGKAWDGKAIEDSARERAKDTRRGVRPDNGRVYGKTIGEKAALQAGEYDLSLKGLLAFQSWTTEWSREVLRVLKPGAFIVVCGAPRSHHRMMCGLEDAGFVVRDCFAWLFGSGFPKNYNLGDGKGTALKPAHEPIALAWKPFKGTIKACHEHYGTAALNIEACRLDVAEGEPNRRNTPSDYAGGSAFGIGGHEGTLQQGRWPANVLLDEEAAAILDEQTGELTSGAIDFARHTDTSSRNVYGGFPNGDKRTGVYDGNCGGASRFYYVAKPSREERDLGTEGLIARQRDESRKDGNPGGDNPRNRGLQPRGNFHPTVKPVELMRWLVKLVTPPDGIVLDPFTGSGTTGMACRYEHRQFIGIEREADYIAIAERRIAAVAPLFHSEASA